jgi:pimeloyl-ACP methyl ester carboxylesterase
MSRVMTSAARALAVGGLALAALPALAAAEAGAAPAPTTPALRETVRQVDTPRGALEVIDSGPKGGPMVLLLPSLGRGARDFDDLAGKLAVEGYRVLRPEPRGIGRSAPYTGSPTLVELAEDALAAVPKGRGERLVVVGHAFGNRVARTLASRHPDRVRALVLLAAGGKVRMEPDIEKALVQSFDLSLPEAERMKHVATAFFAPGNDPYTWRDGWYAKVAETQIAATDRTPVDSWWTAGDAPILVIQPLQDVLAPRENAERLKAEGGDRVTVVYVDRAGHALLPEQPAAVAGHVLAYLGSLPR